MEHQIDPNFSNLIHHGERDAIKAVRLGPYGYDAMSGGLALPDFETYVALQ